MSAAGRLCVCVTLRQPAQMITLAHVALRATGNGPGGSTLRNRPGNGRPLDTMVWGQWRSTRRAAQHRSGTPCPPKGPMDRLRLSGRSDRATAVGAGVPERCPYLVSAPPDGPVQTEAPQRLPVRRRAGVGAIRNHPCARRRTLALVPRHRSTASAYGKASIYSVGSSNSHRVAYTAPRTALPSDDAKGRAHAPDTVEPREPWNCAPVRKASPSQSRPHDRARAAAG